jgi:hypothetical protein
MSKLDRERSVKFQHACLKELLRLRVTSVRDERKQRKIELITALIEDEEKSRELGDDEGNEGRSIS